MSMDEDVNLRKKKNLEWITWSTVLTSLFAEGVTYTFTNSPSGLEQYLNKIDNTSGPLFLVGGGIALWSMADRRSYGKGGLATGGLYGIIRHPIYSGFRLVSLGALIANPSIENIIAGASVFLTTEITARAEEKMLKSLYGTEFLDYKEKVPMWIPYANHLMKTARTMKGYFINRFKGLINS